MRDATLKQLRKRIDAIDERLLELINERASCAVDVAAVKRELSEAIDEGVDFFRPDREAQVINRLKSLNQGPLSDDEVGRLMCVTFGDALPPTAQIQAGTREQRGWSLHGDGSTLI